MPFGKFDPLDQEAVIGIPRKHRPPLFLSVENPRVTIETKICLVLVGTVTLHAMGFEDRKHVLLE